MAPRVLSDAELEALTSWPPEVAHSDLVEYFTLDVDDLRWVRSHRGAAARLGLAVQLCALRFLGFVPGDLSSTPAEVTERLAERVGVAPSALARYVAAVDGRLRRAGEPLGAGDHVEQLSERPELLHLRQLPLEVLERELTAHQLLGGALGLFAVDALLHPLDE